MHSGSSDFVDSMPPGQQRSGLLLNASAGGVVCASELLSVAVTLCNAAKHVPYGVEASFVQCTNIALTGSLMLAFKAPVGGFNAAAHQH